MTLIFVMYLIQKFVIITDGFMYSFNEQWLLRYVEGLIWVGEGYTSSNNFETNLKRILRDRFGTNFEVLILVILKAQFLYVGWL